MKKVENGSLSITMWRYDLWIQKRILKEYEAASIGFVKLEGINVNGLPKVGQQLKLVDKSGL